MTQEGCELYPPVTALTDDPDEVLAVRSIDDQAAFAALYERYTPRIHRYVLARRRNPADVEDVVSAIWMRVCTKIHLYRPERGSFAAWLFTLARNVVYNAARPPEFAREAWMDGGGSTSPSPEAWALKREADSAMHAAIACLTTDQQEALALRYAADLSFPEIGRTLGKSEAAAKMLVRRGIEGLRRQLRQESEPDV